jgi:hypothetical protein
MHQQSCSSSSRPFSRKLQALDLGNVAIVSKPINDVKYTPIDVILENHCSDVLGRGLACDLRALAWVIQ